jgi:hypothetical protein
MMPVARSEHVRTDRARVASDPWGPPPDGRFSEAYDGVVTPGSRMRFWSEDVEDWRLTRPFPVVMWVDWMDQRWLHRQGTVRKMGEHEIFEL